MPKSSRYYYDLMHFSNAGAEVFADIAARRLSPYLAEKFGKFARAAAGAQTAAAPSPDSPAKSR
jgi:hypothetical protein